MEDLKCPKCETVNNFYTELKANNNVARCGVCDTFIKNIPYQTEYTFYFGKYKTKKVSEVEDIDYLKWMLTSKNKLSNPMRDAIQKQIDRLEFLAK